MNQIVNDKSMCLKGVSGIFKANRNSNGEDVDIFIGDDDTPNETFCMLRQQAEANATCMSLSDFIAPKGYDDHLGMFAVSVFGCEQLVSKYELENDDYSKIMVLALADRLVEAFAEFLHMKIRTQMWGYVSDECLDTTDLLKIKYDGIRPAPGYPTQPDHTEKDTMWRLLDAERLAGIKLSETKSMIPASSVSALVFAHRECEYFGVGQIDNEQVVNYASRKRMDVPTVEKWLGPIL